MTSTDQHAPLGSGPGPAAEPTTGETGGPPYGLLVAVIYGVCVVGMSISVLAEMALGYVGTGDQPRSLTEQLIGILGFGTAGLLLSVLPARRLARDPRLARRGAVVYGALSIPALAFFWCGLPALMGAAAAHLAGLTRGRQPAVGAPRVLGLVGLVLAVLNPVVTLVAAGGSWIATAL